MRAYGEIAPKAVFPGNQSNERATQAGLCFEMAMPPDYRPGFAQSTDLRMMLLFGRGRGSVGKFQQNAMRRMVMVCG